jgi:hyperosmotically inducible periplasmic protein
METSPGIFRTHPWFNSGGQTEVRNIGIEGAASSVYGGQMNSKNVLLHSLRVGLALTLAGTAPLPTAAQQNTRAELESPSNRDVRRIEALKEEVRHQLVTLPYYSVFDWLEAEIKADGTVTLIGQVIRPSTKDDAAARVQKLEGATKVMDNIEILPVSTMDDQLRLALYRAIYRFDSPLFRYATQSIPPIHIIVKNGRAVLKGVVASQTDSQLANAAAQGVSGVFEVKNELQVQS